MNDERIEILCLFFKEKYRKSDRPISYSSMALSVYTEMSRAKWEGIDFMVNYFKYIYDDFEELIKDNFDLVETAQNKWVYVDSKEEHKSLSTIEREYYLDKAIANE